MDDLDAYMSESTNEIRVKCIKCGTEWKKECSVCWGPEVFTSSLCDPCFREVIIPVIRRKQLHEGNFDCFGKAGSHCDRFECRYHRWCLSLARAHPQMSL